MKSKKVESNLEKQHRFVECFESLSFDDEAAEVYSRIRTDLEKIGKPIGPNDLLIAAIAVANDMTLVTHNTGEFCRVKGLKIDDWESVGG
jgi:tRNA(fMet)-specific endonuclease VapC